MGRKKVGNVQFNCRINPKTLKDARKVAKVAGVRLGSIIEEALVAYLTTSQPAK